MPDKTITEEEKQVKRIIKRWRILDLQWTMIYVFSTMVLFFFIIKAYAPQWVHNLAIISMMLTQYFMMQSLSRITLKKVLNSLSLDERNALVRYSDANNLTLQGQMVAKALRTYKVVPQIELLRASTEPQDDTLLRAATYTDDTPQDQLLRPTDTP